MWSSPPHDYDHSDVTFSEVDGHGPSEQFIHPDLYNDIHVLEESSTPPTGLFSPSVEPVSPETNIDSPSMRHDRANSAPSSTTPLVSPREAPLTPQDSVAFPFWEEPPWRTPFERMQMGGSLFPFHMTVRHNTHARDHSDERGSGSDTTPIGITPDNLETNLPGDNGSHASTGEAESEHEVTSIFSDQVTFASQASWESETQSRLHLFRMALKLLNYLQNQRLGQRLPSGHLIPDTNLHGLSTLPFDRLETLVIEPLTFPAMGSPEHRSHLFQNMTRCILPTVTQLELGFTVDDLLHYVWDANLSEIHSLASNVRILILRFQDESKFDAGVFSKILRIPRMDTLEQVIIQLEGEYQFDGWDTDRNPFTFLERDALWMLSKLVQELIHISLGLPCVQGCSYSVPPRTPNLSRIIIELGGDLMDMEWDTDELLAAIKEDIAKGYGAGAVESWLPLPVDITVHQA